MRRPTWYILFFAMTFFTGSCITEFIPETGENADMLVVEGLITNKAGNTTVKLSKAQSLSGTTNGTSYTRCTVIITDDLGNMTPLYEKSGGIYIPDAAFTGVVGREYKLTIRTNNTSTSNYTYESVPVKMIPVPSVDTIYYEKQLYDTGPGAFREGCQIWFDSHDPSDKCHFYRWDYSETWMFQLPYVVPNRICWMSANSKIINVKNTSRLSENRITGYPLTFISPESDKLSVKYSLLLNQYSISEDEFEYWDKLKKINDEVGSLYDITPSFIPGNVTCIEDPTQDVLGYFSVSAMSSKRMYISSYFRGLADLYSKCPADTVTNLNVVTDLNRTRWVIEANDDAVPPFYVLTKIKGCADCTVRGTKDKPLWWDNSK
jgi:hypothetical protein